VVPGWVVASCPALSSCARQNASLGERGALSRVSSVHLEIPVWRGIVVKLSFPSPGGGLKTSSNFGGMECGLRGSTPSSTMS
jgi:hypothetical protein